MYKNILLSTNDILFDVMDFRLISRVIIALHDDIIYMISNIQNQAASQTLASLFQLADQQLNQGAYQSAAQAYQIIIKDHHPQNTHLIYGLGARSAIQQWQYDNKIYFKSRHDGVGWAYDGLALCFAKSRPSIGEIYYTKMIQNYPNNLSFVVGLANVYRSIGRQAEAGELYYKILQSNQNVLNNVARKRIAQILYACGKDEQSRNYIKNIQIENDVRMEILQAMTGNDPQDSIAKLIEKYPDYRRLYFLNGFLQEKKGNCQLALKYYGKSLHKMQQKQIYLSAELARIRVLHALKQQQALKICVENHQQNWLIKSYSVIYNKKNSVAVLRKQLETVLALFKADKESNISKSNRQFMLRILSRQYSDKQSIQTNQLSILKQFIQMIASPRQPHINVCIDRIRLQNVELLTQIAQKDGLPANSITKTYEIYQKDQMFAETVPLIFCRHINSHLGKEITWMEIQHQMQQICKIQIEYLWRNSKFQQEKQMQKISAVTIKQSAQLPDLFKDQPYFSSYWHLQLQLKKIANQANLIMNQKLQDISKIISNRGLNLYIKPRVDQKNELYALIWLIHEIIPELALQQQHQLFSKIWQNTNKSFDVTHDGLQMVKSWQKWVSQVIVRRRLSKNPLCCLVSDWIQMGAEFVSQSDIAQTIKQLDDFCSHNEQYGIVQMRGNLLARKQQAVQVILLVQNIGIKIRLVLDRQIDLKNFTREVQRYIDRGIFGAILSVHSKSKPCIRDYCTELSRKGMWIHGGKKENYVAIGKLMQGIDIQFFWQKLAQFQRENLRLNSSQNLYKKGRTVRESVQQKKQLEDSRQQIQYLTQEKRGLMRIYSQGHVLEGQSKNIENTLKSQISNGALRISAEICINHQHSNVSQKKQLQNTREELVDSVKIDKHEPAQNLEKTSKQDKVKKKDSRKQKYKKQQQSVQVVQVKPPIQMDKKSEQKDQKQKLIESLYAKISEINAKSQQQSEKITKQSAQKLKVLNEQMKQKQKTYNRQIKQYESKNNQIQNKNNILLQKQKEKLQIGRYQWLKQKDSLDYKISKLNQQMTTIKVSYASIRQINRKLELTNLDLKYQLNRSQLKKDHVMGLNDVEKEQETKKQNENNYQQEVNQLKSQLKQAKISVQKSSKRIQYLIILFVICTLQIITVLFPLYLFK